MKNNDKQSICKFDLFDFYKILIHIPNRAVLKMFRKLFFSSI